MECIFYFILILYFNPLKTTGFVHQQVFDTYELYILPTLY